jgi:hypothetical protein
MTNRERLVWIIAGLLGLPYICLFTWSINSLGFVSGVRLALDFILLMIGLQPLLGRY